jgi:DNA gyrase subunit B
MQEYTAKQIEVLEGLEPVRKRPGMYIGSTGSEGLHHLIWEVVDNSLTYDTPVLIKENGLIQLKKIGEVVDSIMASNQSKVVSGKDMEILRSGFDIKVLSFDPQTLKLSWAPVSSLIRHKVNSEIYEITLQNNRKIQITPYHSLFTIKNGEIIPISGAELKIGSYIVVPKVFVEPENYITEINLFEELLRLPPSDTIPIFLCDIKNILTDEVKPFIKKYCKENNLDKKISGRTWSHVFYDFKRYDYLPFNVVRTFPQEIRQRFNSCRLYAAHNKKFKLKPILPVDKYLVELLGIYSAEGTICTGKTIRVVFSFGSHETDLIQYTIELIEKVFGYKAKSHYAHETANTVQIDSYLIGLIFKEIFKTGKNSHEKVVPSLIFNINPILRERYLIAYLAGDGHPSKEFTKHLVNDTSPGLDSRSKYTAVSASSSFIDGLSYLLYSLGKTFSIGETNKKREGTIKITYHNKVKASTFKTNLRTKRIDFYWNTNSSYLNYVPTNQIISKIYWHKPCCFTINTQGGASLDKIRTLLKENKVMLYPNADRFLYSDLGVVKVKNIKKIPYNYPWVYDFSVPNGENFVAGFAPIVCHNSIDEAMAGYAKNIEIRLLKDNFIEVKDDGRGIPVDIHPKTKKSALETILTVLHSGGKFSNQVYKVSGGLHGVGVSVVNALSEKLIAEVKRDGFVWHQEFSEGKPITKLKKIAKTKETGTKITFKPDKKIFKDIEFDLEKIISHIKEQAFLTPGVRFYIIDERKNKKEYSFYFENGVKSFIRYLSFSKKPIQQEIFYINEKEGDVFVEVGVFYIDGVETIELSFTNNIKNQEGGTHLTGFRSGITKAINEFVREKGLLKEKDENFSGDDVREGLLGIVSVKMPNPQFEGQTKSKLGNPEIRSIVENIVQKRFKEFLEINQSDAKNIFNKVLLSYKARKAAKLAKESILRKSALTGFNLPGKLADCSTRKKDEAEIFIVEGDSAGGSAKQARNRIFQAVFPLRGKILNVEKARIDKILKSEEIKNLIIALGTNFGKDFNYDGLRYSKIIIATDADSVTGDTPLLVYDKLKDMFLFRRIKDLASKNDYNLKILSLNNNSKKAEIKDIINFVIHPKRTPIYQIKTYLGYFVNITAFHSVYVYEKGEIKTKRGDKIKEGDYLVFVKSLPRNDKDYIIDLKDTVLKYHQNEDIRIKVPFSLNFKIPNSAWCDIPLNLWEDFKKKRVMLGFSRVKLGSKLNIYPLVLEQLENKIDNVMPRWGDFKKYISALNIKELNSKVNIYLPICDIKYQKISEDAEFYLGNHTRKIKTKFVVNEKFAYLLGWYLGDGIKAFQKKNPNRFTLIIGEDKKEKYLKNLKKTIKEVLGVKPIIEKRKNIYYVHFNSFSFRLILEYFGLLNKKSFEKFIPDMFFNVKPKIQKSLLRGLLESDGFIIVSKDKAVYGFKISSRDLAEGIITIFRQLGIFPSYTVSKNKDHYLNGKLIKSNHLSYSVYISTIDYFNKTKNIWRFHKSAKKLKDYIKKTNKNILGKNKFIKEITKNIVALPVRSIKKIKVEDDFVYDISVLNNHNFVDINGILLHNTDGSHIRTLLLTLFYRYFRPLIEKGHVYIAQPPLYKILAGKEVYYAYSDEEKEKIVKELSNKKLKFEVQRYKGLGEMNPEELWETTMDPQKRILKKVTIKDAEEAERYFSILMGEEVEPRKKFIEIHAPHAKNIDI